MMAPTTMQMQMHGFGAMFAPHDKLTLMVRFPNRTGASTKTFRFAYLRKMSIVMQADVDPAPPRFRLGSHVGFRTGTRFVRSGGFAQKAYCSWVKPGSVRKPNLPGLGTAKFTRMVRLGNRTYRAGGP